MVKMRYKFLIIVMASIISTACGGIGWWAVQGTNPLKKNPIEIKTAIASDHHNKSHSDNFTRNTITEIKSPQQVLITTIPWFVIWLLMIGWPLALIGWMIDPPCEIYRRYKRRHRKCHVEHHESA